MPESAKPITSAASNFAAGVLSHAPQTALGKWNRNVAGTSLWPYQANVVWQDTSSNATYCPASAALGS